jgi:hypothetical protein
LWRSDFACEFVANGPFPEVPIAIARSHFLALASASYWKSRLLAVDASPHERGTRNTDAFIDRTKDRLGLFTPNRMF